MRALLAFATSLPLAAFACSRGGSSARPDIHADPAGTPAVPPGAAAVPPVSPAIDARSLIREAASAYDRYAMVDDTPHLAPGPCANTNWRPSEPLVEIRKSRAPEGELHGRKLYYLYVSNHEAYLHPGEGPDARSPVGQTIIKESWVAREAPRGEEIHRSRKLVENGHTWTSDEKSDLFIMIKLAPGTAGTDEGWIYGVTTADGRRVPESGVVESCAGCHRAAPHDRLFGPIKSERDGGPGSP